MIDDELKLEKLSVKSIVNSKTNPRSQFDQEEIQELAGTIVSHGLIEPIVVRPVKKGKSSFYELVVGDRRLRAHKFAGLEFILCRIRELTDEQVFEIQIIENLQRKDVHYMDEAAAFEVMHTQRSMSHQMIAERLNKRPEYIARRLKLNSLSNEFKKRAWSNELPVTHALEICRLSEEDQDKLSKFKWQGEIPTLIQLQKSIEDNFIRNLSKAPFSTQDETLIPSAGACTNCPKRSGFNTTLFPDIQNVDRCFDGQCFSEKLIAGIQLKMQAFFEKNVESIIPVYWNRDSAPGKDKNWLKIFPKALEQHTYLRTKKDSCDSCSNVISLDKEPGRICFMCSDGKGCKEKTSFKAKEVDRDPVKQIESQLERNKELEVIKISEKVKEAAASVFIYSPENSKILLISDHAADILKNTLILALNLMNRSTEVQIFKVYGRTIYEYSDEKMEARIELVNHCIRNTNFVNLVLASFIHDYLENNYSSDWSLKEWGLMRFQIAEILGVDLTSIKSEVGGFYEKKNNRLQEKLSELNPVKA